MRRQLTETEVLSLPNYTKVWVQFPKTNIIKEGTFENYYGAYPLVDDILLGRIADTSDSDLTKIWLEE